MKITLVPYAGLCNRMHAILSAVELKQNYNHDIIIYWEKTDDCFANFDDLFLPIDGFSINPLKRFYLKPSNKKNLRLPSLLRKLVFDCEYIGQKIANEHVFENSSPLNVYVCSTNRFCPYGYQRNVAGIFKPQEYIQNIIDSVVSLFGDYTIGIHIRRTDNVASIKSSPIQLFEENISKIIAAKPNVKFFLATDDNNLKKDFVQKYGDRMITYNSELSRGSLQGMIDAVVELYCLGHTSKILGSAASTYSLFASKLYNSQIEIISH